MQELIYCDAQDRCGVEQPEDEVDHEVIATGKSLVRLNLAES